MSLGFTVLIGNLTIRPIQNKSAKIDSCVEAVGDKLNFGIRDDSLGELVNGCGTI